MLLEINKKLDKLEKQEVRLAAADSLDMVFYTKDTPQWLGVLEDIFGPPLKAPGESASKEAKQITKPYGGIQKEQCLFTKDHETSMIIAMLWPWQNGRCTTLKMFLTDKPQQKNGGWFPFFGK